MTRLSMPTKISLALISCLPLSGTLLAGLAAMPLLASPAAALDCSVVWQSSRLTHLCDAQRAKDGPAKPVGDAPAKIGRCPVVYQSSKLARACDAQYRGMAQ